MRDHKLSSLSNLLGGTLSRYGIGERVVAAQIVSTANELLVELMGRQAEDIHVLSYKDGQLEIACKSPTARYAAEGMTKTLARKLEERYPNQTFRTVDCRLKTGAASDDEWYNSGTL